MTVAVSNAHLPKWFTSALKNIEEYHNNTWFSTNILHCKMIKEMFDNRVDGYSDSKPLLMERYIVYTIINYHSSIKAYLPIFMLHVKL